MIQVDKERIEGSAQQAEGLVKEAIGKLTGDAKLEAEGQSRQGRRKASERSWRPTGRSSRQIDAQP
jgi:uncharacterized protein YjbJ (UPF0337 family)